MDKLMESPNNTTVLIAATNRPHKLDEMARKRFVTQIHITLPDHLSRKQILCKLLKLASANITDNELDEMSRITDGYSIADLEALCSEAAMGPIRDIPFSKRFVIDRNDVRTINMDDLVEATKSIKKSVPL